MSNTISLASVLHIAVGNVGRFPSLFVLPGRLKAISRVIVLLQNKLIPVDKPAKCLNITNI